MIKRLLLAVLTLLLACGFAHDDPYELDLVTGAMHYDGVETTVGWEDCGMVNAFYNIPTKHVTMCNELKPLPAGVIRYILAHELAHGVIIQRDVAFTGSGEWAADELAALTLIWLDRAEDVKAGGDFWASMGRDEDPFDDHYGDNRRAVGLWRLYLGATTDNEDFTYYYRHAMYAWLRLLDMK